MKVTPRTRPEFVVEFSTLKPGDTFIYQGCIWLKMESRDQEGVNLSTGVVHTDMCEDTVVPVDATLTWKRKKGTPKKKK